MSDDTLIDRLGATLTFGGGGKDSSGGDHFRLATEPIQVIFPKRAQSAKSKAGAQRQKNASVAAQRSVFWRSMHFFERLSLWTLFKVALLITVVLYEAFKFNSCFIQSRDLVQRDFGAKQESVCTDHRKISQFGHRFGDGCEKARLSVEEGVLQSSFSCFVAKHKIYTFASFDNVYMNAVLVIVALYGLSLVKDYYAQLGAAKHHAETMRHQQQTLLQMYKQTRQKHAAAARKRITAAPYNDDDDLRDKQQHQQ